MPEVTQVDKDDSLKLSGLNLDLSVAHACDFPCPAGGSHEYERSLATGCYKCQHTLPLYSSSIEAAMEVVEKMRQGGWCFEIDCYPEDYNVSAYNSGTSGDITEEYLSNIKTRTESYRCESLAKAICLAALEASGTDAAELFDLNEANEAFWPTENKK